MAGDDPDPPAPERRPLNRRTPNLDRSDALLRAALDFLGRCEQLQAALDHLARRLPDVPLHQRGFGVMDEPPA
jgi:hypothetical protein